MHAEVMTCAPYMTNLDSRWEQATTEMFHTCWHALKLLAGSLRSLRDIFGELDFFFHQ